MMKILFAEVNRGTCNQRIIYPNNSNERRMPPRKLFQKDPKINEPCFNIILKDVKTEQNSNFITLIDGSKVRMEEHVSFQEYETIDSLKCDWAEFSFFEGEVEI